MMNMIITRLLNNREICQVKREDRLDVKDTGENRSCSWFYLAKSMTSWSILINLPNQNNPNILHLKSSRLLSYPVQFWKRFTCWNLRVEICYTALQHALEMNEGQFIHCIYCKINKQLQKLFWFFFSFSHLQSTRLFSEAVLT